MTTGHSAAQRRGRAVCGRNPGSGSGNDKDNDKDNDKGNGSGNDNGFAFLRKRGR